MYNRPLTQRYNVTHMTLGFYYTRRQSNMQNWRIAPNNSQRTKLMEMKVYTNF